MTGKQLHWRIQARETPFFPSFWAGYWLWQRFGPDQLRNLWWLALARCAAMGDGETCDTLDPEEVRETALELALEHQIVVPQLTALIVIASEEYEVDATPRDPGSLAMMMSASASMTSAMQPVFWLLHWYGLALATTRVSI